MTRLEAGAVALDVEWQSVEEMVGAALARAEQAGGAGRVRVDLPADLPLLPCDGTLVEQVLVNLLENALKYSAPGTAVEVSAEGRPAEVVLSVADRGPGVPAGEEEAIFEKFYRARAPREADGVGLGLAICRSIVAAHGGRTWAEARPGGGAVFRVALPRKDPPPTAPAVDESP
jgi:two-component system, OmpR family, sensor histidine kinase KdpD